MDSSRHSCPVCSNPTFLFDVVDFSKSCEEKNGKFLKLSGEPIYYYCCEVCNFLFAKEMYLWSPEKFKTKIYNKDYIDVDPDYLKLRPQNNANIISEMFKNQKVDIKHLDYGGGNGLLSKKLKEDGFDSKSYDPFTDLNININNIGKFNLITAFEVFEHVADVKKLMNNLKLLLEDQGLILFSTLISDNKIIKNQRLTWWYVAPRNGHISIFSRKSLSTLSRNFELNFGSFDNGFHILCKKVPSWASHLIK